MVPKLLAWTAFALAAVFAVIAFVVVFARESLGDNAMVLLFYGGLPLLGLSMLVAVALLIQAIHGAGTRNMVYGVLWCIGGIAATAASYALASPGGTYFVWTGAIFIGVIQFWRGLMQTDE